MARLAGLSNLCALRGTASALRRRQPLPTAGAGAVPRVLVCTCRPSQLRAAFQTLFTMNSLNTPHDSFNQPRSALSDLVALLSLADVDGSVSQAIHTQGMDDAFIQALEQSVKALDHDGINKIARRYDLPAATVDKMRALVPANDFPTSTALEVGHVNLLRLTENAKALDGLVAWLKAEATHQHMTGASDFIVNLACSLPNVPDLLEPVISKARERGYGYLFMYLE